MQDLAGFKGAGLLLVANEWLHAEELDRIRLHRREELWKCEIESLQLPSFGLQFVDSSVA